MFFDRLVLFARDDGRPVASLPVREVEGFQTQQVTRAFGNARDWNSLAGNLHSEMVVFQTDDLLMFNNEVLNLVFFRLWKVTVGTTRICKMGPRSAFNRISMREQYGILGPLLVIR
jgi:hypothetical protein